MLRFKRLEIALVLGLAAAILTGAAAANKTGELAHKMIRLHVVAHSDSPEDQSMKALVRDAVAETAEELLGGARTVEEARGALSRGLDALLSEARQTVSENGGTYDVKVTLATEYFPTKRYDTFALPAGEYEAIRIILGDGRGQNWWCVVFPPLCLPAAAGETELIAAVSGLDKGEIALITEDGPTYKLKFKAAELFGELKEWMKKSG